MNKIFRKCSDFGLMVRINHSDPDAALEYVEKISQENIPLVVFNLKKSPIEVLKKIAFSADLFIAGEGADTIEDIYNLAGNGAQFFILDHPELDLMKNLDALGFFYIVKANSIKEIKTLEELGVEALLLEENNLIKEVNIPYVFTGETDTSKLAVRDSLFSIVNMSNEDPKLWINTIVKKYLGLNYYKIEYKRDQNQEIIDFAEIFSITNKSEIIPGNNNRVFLYTWSVKQSINYFKWRGTYIDPERSIVKNNRIINGPLDKKLGEYEIILTEEYI